MNKNGRKKNGEKYFITEFSRKSPRVVNGMTLLIEFGTNPPTTTAAGCEGTVSLIRATISYQNPPPQGREFPIFTC